ncbi:MAG: dihydropteroate synthase [Myxococcales bacterium]|nr:dihydropteroate synthase [Myxococcales bacterium]
MGVVNVTPDSFSDGGRFDAVDAAVAHALALVEQGAQFIDVGGESSRPGAEPVDAATECARVVPVIAALRPRTDAVISIDTTKAEVAQAALAAGAEVVNDISAGRADPALMPLVAKAGAGFVLMHMRGTPQTMQLGELRAADRVGEMVDHLAARVEAAMAAGVAREALCLDPGIGFGKTVEQNCALIGQLPRLGALGRPVLVGASRKSFLGALTDRPVEARGPATFAACAAAIWQGAQVLRVHDVAEVRDVVRVVEAIRATAQVGP